MQLFADFHTHTRHSHGTGTVLDNVRAARAAGLQMVGITDHGPANLFHVGVQGLHVFAQIKAEARRAESLVPAVKVLVGVEANVIGTDGRLDIPPELQEKLDIVQAGLHVLVRPHSWIDAAGLAGKNLLARWRPRFRRPALVANTDALVAAVYRNRIDIVTHPGYRLPIDTRELAKACAARGTALEINTSHPHTTVAYIRLAAAAGAWLVVGSDAHEPARVGDLAAGIRLLEEAGIPAAQVLNACGPAGM